MVCSSFSEHKHNMKLQKKHKKNCTQIFWGILEKVHTWVCYTNFCSLVSCSVVLAFIAFSKSLLTSHLYFINPQLLQATEEVRGLSVCVCVLTLHTSRSRFTNDGKIYMILCFQFIYCEHFHRFPNVPESEQFGCHHETYLWLELSQQEQFLTLIHKDRILAYLWAKNKTHPSCS